MTWGWFNEGPSNDPKACPAYKANSDQARARDPTRFTTWASDKDLRDVCLEHASLVSFNNYPSWYNSAKPADQWNKFANAVAGGAVPGAQGKPMVISETGAGGIYEWSHNATDAKWTTKYQTEIISQDVDVALANSNISGITLWHFFDLSVRRAQPPARPADGGTAARWTTIRRTTRRVSTSPTCSRPSVHTSRSTAGPEVPTTRECSTFGAGQRLRMGSSQRRTTPRPPTSW